MAYNGWFKEDFIKEMDKLYKIIGEQYSELQRLKSERDRYKLMSEGWRVKNERNAGRKPKINQDVIDKVKQCRLDGMTYRAIAQEMCVSVGLVYKAMKCAKPDSSVE